MTKYESIKDILIKIMRLNRLGKLTRFIKTMIKEAVDRIRKNKDSSERVTYQQSVIIDHSDISKPFQIKHQTEKTLFRENGTELDQTIYQRELENDIDFSNLEGMEEYADNRSIKKETIEQWVAAGILLPDEIRVAEKLIKKMHGKKKCRQIMM